MTGGKVVSLVEWRARRRGGDFLWHVMILEALRDLAEYGIVYVTDVRLAEDIWQAAAEMDEVYVLHGDSNLWAVARADGKALMGGD